MSSREGAALADHQRADAELANQAAAIPARRERRNHHQVAITALPAGAAKGIRLAVDAGIALLHTAVTAPAQQFDPRE